MPQGSDANKMRLLPYLIRFDSVDLGFSTDGTTRIRVNGNFIIVENAEQLRGVVKLWRAGFIIEVLIELKDASPATINGLAMPGEKVVTNGDKRLYGLGDRTQSLNERARELHLHPSGRNLSDTGDDWKFTLAAITSEIELVGSNTEPQVLPLTFKILPDFTASPDFRYGRFGNWEIAQGVPHGVFLAFEKRLQVPALHTPAITIPAGGTVQAEAYEAQSIETTTTLQIDQVGGILIGDTSVPYDNLLVAGAIVPGQYVRFANGEVAFVKDVVPNVGLVSGVLTLTRAVHGTDAFKAAHADDVVMTILDEVGVTRMTESTDNAFSSDDLLDVTVGDSFNDTLVNKGLITNVQAGGANVEVVFATVTSPPTAVTTL